ncbi:calcium calmodulin-dependent protein kinase type 1G, variant 2 [Balamuthia mandrillaris]
MGSCLSKGGDDDHKKPTKAKTKDPEHEGESKSAQESSKPAERRPIPQGKKINNNELPEDFIIFEPIEDEFDLGEEIGKGGFSVVYKATRKKDGEEFAVKCIKKKLVEGDDIKLLRREIQIMTQLEHPNILKLFQVYEDDEQFYLVMELVKGKELFDKIVERGMYSERDASNIIFQVVSAVDYLHENGIAHRDLKPENLLAAGDGADEIIKIADFGFAKSFSEDGEKLMTSCGSPGYVGTSFSSRFSLFPLLSILVLLSLLLFFSLSPLSSNLCFL